MHLGADDLLKRNSTTRRYPDIIARYGPAELGVIASATDTAKRALRRVGMVLVAVIALTACTGGGSSGACGTGDANHCYSVAQWHMGTSTGRGAFTVPTALGAMTSGQGYFITNELWVRDTNCGQSYCFIETGEASFNGAAPELFWGDLRPGDGYNLHDIQSVSSLSGDGTTYMIDAIPAIDPAGTFTVSIAIPGRLNYVGKSTSNSMSPNNLIVGEELAGSTNGASASSTTFDFSGYFDANNSVFGVDRSAAKQLVQAPLSGAWTSPESWTTRCC